MRWFPEKNESILSSDLYIILLRPTHPIPSSKPWYLPALASPQYLQWSQPSPGDGRSFKCQQRRWRADDPRHLKTMFDTFVGSPHSWSQPSTQCDSEHLLPQECMAWEVVLNLGKAKKNSKSWQPKEYCSFAPTIFSFRISTFSDSFAFNVVIRHSAHRCS